MREEKPSYGKANGLKQEIESRKQNNKYKLRKSAKEAKIDEWK